MKKLISICIALGAALALPSCQTTLTPEETLKALEAAHRGLELAREAKDTLDYIRSEK